MITPDALPSNLQQFKHRIWEIEEMYGFYERYAPSGRGYGDVHLSKNTPNEVKKEYKDLKKKVENYEMPDNEFFRRGDELYKLWVNRESDEPVSFKMLYNIVEEIAHAITRAEVSAAYANYDGR